VMYSTVFFSPAVPGARPSKASEANTLTCAATRLGSIFGALVVDVFCAGDDGRKVRLQKVAIEHSSRLIGRFYQLPSRRVFRLVYVCRSNSVPDRGPETAFWKPCHATRGACPVPAYSARSASWRTSSSRL
jgi:hypothetical protein